MGTNRLINAKEIVREKEKEKEIAKDEKNNSKGKAVWTPKLQKVFIDLCIREIRAGNRPTTHFNKTGWKNIIRDFSIKTEKDYDKQQLKNRWDVMKKEWLVWNSLVDKETGLGWDHAKQTVDASDEWWDNKILRNPDVAKYREKGLEHCFLLDELFKGTAATSARAWAPTSGVMHPCFSEDTTIDLDMPTELLTEEDTNPEVEIEDGVSSTKERKRKRVMEVKTFERTRKNITTGEKLNKNIERLVDAVVNKTKVQPNNQGCSIKDVIDLVYEIPNMTSASPLFMLATRLFKIPENREMFVALHDAEARVAWLQQELEREYASFRI